MEASPRRRELTCRVEEYLLREPSNAQTKLFEKVDASKAAVSRWAKGATPSDKHRPALERFLDRQGIYTSLANFEALSELLAAKLREDANRAESRVILLVGSGADGQRSWESLGRDLLKHVLGGYTPEGQRELILRIEERLRPAIGLGALERWHRGDDEALRGITTDRIAGAIADIDVARQRMSEWFVERNADPEDSAGPPPRLHAELIAHMLKHRMINHVWDFDLGRSIDRAIELELGASSFEHVPGSLSGIDVSEIRKPIHAKMHGSIAVPGSLQFGMNSALSKATIELMDRMAFAEAGEAKPAEGARPGLILVGLGYSWANPSLLQWISASGDKIEAIYAVRRSAEPMRHLSDALGKGRKTLHLVSTDVLADDGKSQRSKRTASLSIDHALWLLLELVYERSREQQPNFDEPPPLARHLILNDVCGTALREKPRRSEQTADGRDRNHPERRLQVEMLLSALKLKGMSNSMSWSEDRRVGSFAEMDARPLTVTDNLSELLAPSPEPEETDTYYLTARTVDDFAEAFVDKFGIRHGGAILKPVIHGPTGDHVTLEPVDPAEFYREHLGAIFRSSEIEVTPETDGQVAWFFANPQPIRSQRELVTRERELVIGQKWQYLFAITEWSDWLEHYLTKRRDKGKGPRKVVVIEPSYPQAGDRWLLHSEMSVPLVEHDGVHRFVTDVSWREHNRHVLVLLNKHGEFLGGTYTRRFLRASQVAPVYVEGADCAELLRVFVGYLGRAQRNDASYLALCQVVRNACKQALAIPRTWQGGHGPRAKARFRAAFDTFCAGLDG